VINGSDACGLFDCDTGDITSTCVISSHKQLPGHLCLDGRGLGALVITAGGSIECSPSLPSCRIAIAMRSIHVAGTLEASEVRLHANVNTEVSGEISATGPLETYDSDCTGVWGSSNYYYSGSPSYGGYRMCSGSGGGHSALGGDAVAYDISTTTTYTVPRLGSSSPLNIENVVQPSSMGRSGGRGAYWDGYRYSMTDGGTGGGRIQIFTPLLTLTGRIAADGKQPSSSCSFWRSCTSSTCIGSSSTASTCDACHCGGGGAGGSISIEAQRLWGKIGGRISCNGADAKGHGGAGAGGHIALRYDFISDSLVLEARGGRAMSSSRSGGAGSIAHIVASALYRVDIANDGDALGAPLALNFSSETSALRVQHAHVNLSSDALFQSIDFNNSVVQTSDAITVQARGIRMEKSSVIAAGSLNVFTTENFAMSSSSSISGPNMMNLSISAGVDFIMSSSSFSLTGSTATVRISTGEALIMSSSSSMSLTGSSTALSIATGTDLIMSSLSSITGSKSAVSISTGKNLIISSTSSVAVQNWNLLVHGQLSLGSVDVFDINIDARSLAHAIHRLNAVSAVRIRVPSDLVVDSIVAPNISIYVDGTFDVCNLEALNIEANATTIRQGRSACRISVSGKVTTRINRTAGRDCCGQACDDGSASPTFDSTNFAGAGGGNGGEGGGCGRNGLGGGLTAGDINNPWEYGGPGGDGAAARKSPDTYKCPPGGNGGGRIRLFARETMQISGTVEADGGSPSGCSGGSTSRECEYYGCWGGCCSHIYNHNLPSAAGGGAGGSIQLLAGHLQGNGLVSANGGAGGRITYTSDSSYTSRSGGGGGGGRIAAVFSRLSKGVRFEAKGGTSSAGHFFRGSGGSVALLAHADEALYTFFNCTYEKTQDVKAAALRSPFSLSLTEHANVTLEGATSVGRVVLSQSSRLELRSAPSGLPQRKLVARQMVMQAKSVFKASDYAILVTTSMLACNVSVSSLEVGTNLMLTETQLGFDNQPCSIISNQITVGQSIIAPYRSLIASHTGMSLSIMAESMLASRISSEKSILANITKKFELDENRPFFATCSGSQCGCDDVHAIADSGVITRKLYGSGQDCKWMIRGFGVGVHVRFPNFVTCTGYSVYSEYSDVVKVYSCSDEMCSTKTLLASLTGTGVSPATTYSSAGFMLLEFSTPSYGWNSNYCGHHSTPRPPNWGWEAEWWLDRMSSVQATDDVRITAGAMTMHSSSRIVAGSLVDLHISAYLQASDIICGESSLRVGGSLYMWPDATLATQRKTKWEIAGDVSGLTFESPWHHRQCTISSAQDAITVDARQVELPCSLSAHQAINIATSGTFLTTGDISTPIFNVSSSGAEFRNSVIESQNVLLNVEGHVSLEDVVMIQAINIATSGTFLTTGDISTPIFNVSSSGAEFRNSVIESQIVLLNVEGHVSLEDVVMIQAINIATSGTFLTSGDISTPIFNVSSSGAEFRNSVIESQIVLLNVEGHVSLEDVVMIESQNVLLNVEGHVSLEDVVMKGNQSGVETNLFQISGQNVQVQSVVFSNLHTVSIHSRRNVLVQDCGISCEHLFVVANEMVLLTEDSFINVQTAIVLANGVSVSKSRVWSPNFDVDVTGIWSVQESTIVSTHLAVNVSHWSVQESTIVSTHLAVNASRCLVINSNMSSIRLALNANRKDIALFGGSMSSHSIQLQAEGDILLLSNHQIQAIEKIEAQAFRLVFDASSVQCTAAYCVVQMSGGEIELRHQSIVRGSSIQLEATRINVLSDCAQGEGELESCASQVTTSGRGEPSDTGEGHGGDSCGHSVLSVPWQGGGGGAHGGAGADCCFEHGGSGVANGDMQRPWTYGSGGGTGHGGAAGGAGGGRIRLAAVDLLMEGMVTANGLPGAASSLTDGDAASGGGGSGGSIHIVVFGVISGTGVVRANGGSGGPVPNPEHVNRVFKMGGEGSGGRVSIGSALRDPKLEIQSRSGSRDVACRGSSSQAGSVYEYAVSSQSCSAGEYAPLEHFPPSNSCRKCEVGSFKNDTGRGLCTMCPPNSWSQRGSKRVEDCTCNAGYIAFNLNQGRVFCVACQAGKFGRDGNASCTDCPAGTYNTEVGSISAEACLACPENSNSRAGSWTLTDCACNAGHTAAGNPKPCVPCAAGTFKSAAGSLACTACPAGMHSPAGSTRVQDCASSCPTGFYKAAMGSEMCAACPSFSNAQAASQVTDCKCNVGFSGPDGGPCAMCAAGKYKDSPGSGACTACASGTFSLPGSNSSSACVLCPKGTFSPVAASSCQQCAPGTYSAQMGATFCLTCPTNSHSLAGSESLTSCGCNAGYVGSGVVGDRCEACPGPDFSCMDVLSVLKQAYRLYGICTHAYVHMYICIHTYIHAYTCIHTHIQ
jgi:hypothetical protein